MSLDTWKAECYPIPAYETKKSEAGTHSLRKWEGALPEMLKRHNVSYRDNCIIENDYFQEAFAFTADNCALCFHYMKSDYIGDYEHFHRKECENCPLSIVRGGYPCDEQKEDEAESPYLDNPEVMVKWLRLAIEWENREMRDYLTIQTSKEVFLAILERHPEIKVFNNYSAPNGGVGHPETGIMFVSYGFEGGEYPVIEIKTSWKIDPESPKEHKNVKEEYWLCTPVKEE